MYMAYKNLDNNDINKLCGIINKSSDFDFFFDLRFSLKLLKYQGRDNSPWMCTFFRRDYQSILRYCGPKFLYKSLLSIF